MKAFKALVSAELKLSFRGVDMFIFAICMPIVVLVFIGMLYGDRAAFEGASYTFLEQSFGAVSTIAICAGGVMGLPLVIADYRHRKILKRFKVTPVSPTMILLVQVLVYALYSFVSLLSVYAVGALCFGFVLKGSWLHFIGAYLMVMLSMFSIGILVGGIAPNSKIAGVAASVLYFPMLILSGATLPYEIMPAALQKLANVLPLTQGIKLIKAASLGLSMEAVFSSILIMCLIAVFCSTVSILFFKWE